ncbi:hypothetical protein [Bradyrhizobium prioriisuperbiae]|uniref:hypothetical protein n=1 Tax=Bradyrhizobium prioriisuperbiae TaxID=2854389 RepID=UPI0028F095AB|nr:hypothetical protein [Bradyrhizobium prioritasuperba]
MIGVVKKRLAWCVASLLLVSCGTGAVYAQAARKDAPAPAPVTPAATTSQPPISGATAAVEGFRSARFGMTEAEVRSAIIKDLGVKPEAIRSEDNKSEQTHVLLVKAPEVLAGGGASEVSYVFGFKTKKLIQVGVTWSKATDDKMTPDQLFSNSTVLRTHFVSQGYKQDTIATNMPINGGILMFRGSDDKDRTTMLILQGSIAQGENNQRVLTPTALLLFYVADAKTPDVYRLPPGSF